MTLRRAAALLAVAALLLAGCGDRRLVLNIDVLSYLDPSQTRYDFGPLGPVPGGISTGEISLLDQTVNLLEGYDTIAEVRSVDVWCAVVVVDSTGGGDATVRVYASAPDEDPRAFPAVVTVPATLASGVTDTVEVHVVPDARVAQLFTSSRLRLAMTVDLTSTDSIEPLNGRLHLRRLDVTVVSGRREL